MFKEFYWWTTEVVNVYAYYPRRCIGSAYASAVIYVSDLKAIFRDGRFAHAQAERGRDEFQKNARSARAGKATVMEYLTSW